MPNSYVNKPPNVEALLYDGSAMDPAPSRNAIIDWLTDEFALEEGSYVEYDAMTDYFTFTRNGVRVNIQPNNYLVKDANGKIYMQSQSSFEGMYDPAPETP